MNINNIFYPAFQFIIFNLFCLVLQFSPQTQCKIIVEKRFPDFKNQYHINVNVPQQNWNDFYDRFQASLKSNLFNQTSGYLSKTYISPSDPNLLYVSLANNVFILDTDLSVKGRLVLGPIWDYPDCISNQNIPSTTFYSSSQNISYSSYYQKCLDAMNNENFCTSLYDYKVYLMAPYTDKEGQKRLILCGSYRKGSCYYYLIRPDPNKADFFIIKKDLENTQTSLDNDFLVDEGAIGHVGGMPNGPLLFRTFSSRPLSKNTLSVWGNNEYLRMLGISVRTIPNSATQSVSLQTRSKNSCRYYSEYRTPFTYHNYLFFVSVFPYFTNSKIAITCYPGTKSFINTICLGDVDGGSMVTSHITCDNQDGDVVSSMEMTVGEYLAESFSGMKTCDSKVCGVKSGDKILATLFRTFDKKHLICLYSLSVIQESHKQTLTDCVRGWSVLFINDQFARRESETCSMRDTQTIDEFTENNCTRTFNLTLQGPVSSSSTFSATSSFTVPSQSLIVAMEAAISHKHTILHLVTEDKKLLKIVLNKFHHNQSSSETKHTNKLYYQGSFADDDDKGAAKSVSTFGDYLFVSTESTVYKVDTDTCKTHNTCGECLASGDPVCGWCTYTGRCVKKQNCASGRWLDSFDINNKDNNNKNYYDSFCPSVAVMNSTKINIDKTVEKKIFFSVSNMPATSLSYRCIYELSPPEVSPSEIDAQLLPGNTISCGISFLESLQRNVELKVSLKVKLTGNDIPPFASFSFFLFKCSFHESCSGCDLNACEWCVRDSVCSGKCSNNPIINNKNDCLRIKPSQHQVIIGSQERLSISVVNSLSPVDVVFYCKLHPHSPSPMRPFIFIGFPETNEIICPINTSILNPEVKEYTLTISWEPAGGGLRKEFENASNVKAINCAKMSNNDCSQCLALNTSYRCQWCNNNINNNNNNNNGGMCYGDCSNHGGTSNTCPPPVVTKVEPTTILRQAGSVLKIEGRNLIGGQKTIKLMIGGKECELLQNSNDKCIAAEDSKGPFTVMKNGVNYNTNIIITNKQPSISSMDPTYGPMGGGSTVELFGTQLAFEAPRVKVLIENQKQEIISISDDKITFKTGVIWKERETTVTIVLNVDGVVADANQRFTFKLNPKNLRLEPSHVFLAGGFKAQLKGENLKSSSNLQITLKGNPVQLTKWTDSGIDFMMPDLSSNKRKKRSNIFKRSSPSASFLGQMPFKEVLELQFDGLTKLSTFDLISDPHVNMAYRLNSNSTIIIIIGTNLNYPVVRDIAEIKVQGETCSLDGVPYTNETLKEIQNSIENKINKKNNTNNGNNNPNDVFNSYFVCHVNTSFRPEEPLLLTMKVGQNLSQKKPLTIILPSTSTLPPTIDPDRDKKIIIGVVVGAVVVVVLMIMALFLCRKATKTDKKYLKLLKKYQDLQKTISKECKQSFTELQTYVSTFSSDFNDAGIPYFHFPTYSFNFLYSTNNNYRSIVKSSEHKNAYENNAVSTSSDERLNILNQLVNSKSFLLVFIKVLESQGESFGVLDKASMASSLMVVFMDKLDYVTEVIKSLLEELVLKSIEKQQTRIMLRRTDSVVEKLLSNWLSVCMYPYLRSSVGRKLFTLCKAIDFQTDQGPVDSETLACRYTLSQDKLLRVNVDDRAINVSVETAGMETVQCRLLSCDTLEQAKVKCMKAAYKNTPFSTIPHRHDFELRLKTVNHKKGIPLAEFKVSQKSQPLAANDRWVQLKTLEDYLIKDDVTLILYLKSATNNSVKQSNGNSLNNADVIDNTKFDTLRPNESYCYAENPDVQSINQNNNNSNDKELNVFLDSGTRLGTLKLIDNKSFYIYHLVKEDPDKPSVDKVISEVFLSRMLVAKNVLNKYIEDLFKEILTVSSDLPPSIKTLFDHFDKLANKYSVHDNDVVHIWKSNSLLLRYWINAIKNADFIFDIEKSLTRDSCLNVIGQVLIDSCSLHDHYENNESSLRVLFANEIATYKKMVKEFYHNVKMTPSIEQNKTHNFYQTMENEAKGRFDVDMALGQVHKYALMFYPQIYKALEEDNNCNMLKTHVKFQHCCQPDN